MKTIRPRMIGAWPSLSCASAALVIGAVFSAVPTPVRADVKVEGNPTAVRIETRQTTVGDVLAALKKTFDLQFRAKIALDRPVTGTYQGSLSRVLARVLDGYDYVVSMPEHRLEVVVYGTRNRPGAAPNIEGESNVNVRAQAAPTQPVAETPVPPPAPTPAAPSASTAVAAAPAPVRKPDHDAQSPATAMLDSAARSQIPGAAGSPSAQSPVSSGYPSGSEIAALTQLAGAKLDALRTALGRVSH